ncbi:hypothetical protein V8E51_016152 [Hyaloscypha variabilis]
MARDSSDRPSIRPVSAHDAVHQLSSNFSRLSHVGTSLWENTRSRLSHQKSPYHAQRPSLLKRKNGKGGQLGLKRRALTLPLPEKGSSDALWNFQQQTVQQTDSGLCMRLPYEVRSLIFELVVAGEKSVVHVYKKSKRMGHWRCRRQANGLPCTWIEPCSKALPFKAMSTDDRGVLISGDHTMQRYFDRSKILSNKKDHDISPLSLLCTCRQTYTETIPLLYAKTHFHFPGLTDILDFKKHVLPNRFDSIRVLSIDWEPNPFFIASTPQMRVDTWNTISQMKGLQQLRVYIKTLCILPDSSAARSLKQNLRKVTGLQKFQLIVTRDQFPIWNGFLDDDMEVKLTVNTEARGDSSFRPMPATASLVRAY